MNVLTAKGLELDTRNPHEDLVLELPPASAQPLRTEPTLTAQQEAFLQDRFTTKLEDPRTGRWIRSWRTEE
ncbi:MAG: hypothetical protein OEV01_02005 [Nitrospira sp.]|nr:hypothetical protein [Nitrospira sp.]